MRGPQDPGGRLLLLGASARALAASAALSVEARRRFPGGLLVVDYFGDTDLAADRRRPRDPEWPDVVVASVSRDLGLPRTSSSLGRAALHERWSALAFTGGLENRPGLLRLLARRRAVGGETGVLLGNGPQALRFVRDPRRLFGFLAARGIPHAAARFEMPSGGHARYLVKKVRSAGGSGTRAPVPGEPLPPGHFLQERLRGPIGSAAFLACDRGAFLLGITEQLAGWAALGASGFRYAGSIAGPASAFLSGEALGRIDLAAQRITERFGLRGLNGLDYVVQDGVPHLIEVNPRWTASMELIEERLGRNLFDLHLKSLEAVWEGPGRRSLPLEAEAGDGARRFLAKGILYATHDCVAPDPVALAALGARDRPRAGESLAAGQPICTLIVRADGADACRSRLRESADAARALLRPA
jgi:uncharacterized protein